LYPFKAGRQAEQDWKTSLSLITIRLQQHLIGCAEVQINQKDLFLGVINTFFIPMCAAARVQPNVFYSKPLLM